MNVVARNYSSGAEMIASAHAIRNRLFGKPRLVNIMPARVVDPEPPRYWQSHKTRFDSHVYCHRRWIEALEKPCKVYIKRRSRELGVTYASVVGPSRKQKAVLPRQMIMWEIKTYVKPDISFVALGKLFDRDHKTAFYTFHKVNDLKARGEI